MIFRVLKTPGGDCRHCAAATFLNELKILVTPSSKRLDVGRYGETATACPPIVACRIAAGRICPVFLEFISDEIGRACRVMITVRPPVPFRKFLSDCPDQFLGCTLSGIWFLEIGQRFEVKNRADVVKEEVVEPNRLVHAERLKK